VVLTYVAIGLVAGVFSGVFGVGGGVIIIPLLVLAAKMSHKAATGTSLAVFVLPVVLLGAMSHWRAGNVNVKASLIIAGSLFVGSFFGAQISLGMSDAMLKRAFAVMLVAVAGRLWFSV
jgi:uncharacterized membrane protein YfcA